MTRLRLDHIVLGAASLEEGRRWLESRLELPPVGGGKHALMGTHNALWRLDCSYLELIAIDPDAPRPARPRWFGLDSPVTAARLRTRPRLLTWVASTNGLALDQQTAPVSIGQILAASRDSLAWKISVAKDGMLPLDGVFPTFIEWARNVRSPAVTLPDQGLMLEQLRAGLQGDRARFLSARGIAAPVVFDEKPGLRATIAHPATGKSMLLD